MTANRDRLRAVRVQALERSGWIVTSTRGAGSVTHPDYPHSTWTIAAAIRQAKRGMPAPTPLRLSAPWPLAPRLPADEPCQISDTAADPADGWPF